LKPESTIADFLRYGTQLGVNQIRAKTNKQHFFLAGQPCISKREFVIGKKGYPPNTGLACQEFCLFVCFGPHLFWFGTVHTQLGAISPKARDG
jgi:hypothetical protein